MARQQSRRKMRDEIQGFVFAEFDSRKALVKRDNLEQCLYAAPMGSTGDMQASDTCSLRHVSDSSEGTNPIL